MARKKVFLPEIAAPAGLSNGIIRVETTKSGKRRDVPMTGSVRAEPGRMRIKAESKWVFVQKDDGTDAPPPDGPMPSQPSRQGRSNPQPHMRSPIDSGH